MELNINYQNIKQLIAYQNKKHTFNWLNTLHVTFAIPRCRLGCWYRQVYISIYWYRPVYISVYFSL